MKHILGLDLGTNSIGWALIELDHQKKTLRIIHLGVRILPMDAQEFSKFNAGEKVRSAAKNRSELHRTRITRERYLLRRDRLHLVLNLLEALPEHYKLSIEFENEKGMRSGKFKENVEPKLAYLPTKNTDNKHEFLFENAFNEMIQDIQKVNPDIKNEKKRRIPRDWTLYYLRQKALKEKISLEELAWVLLSYNQKRGSSSEEINQENDNSNEIKEFLDLKVVKVEPKQDKRGNYYEITLNDSESTKYKEYTTEQLTFVDDIKEVTRILKTDEKGDVIHKDTSLIISDLYELELSKIEREDIEDKKFKFKYYFHYKNGWCKTKKSAKENYGYESLKQKLEEGKEVKSELYVIKTEYDSKGNPLKETANKSNPKIELPDFNNEGSKDWTLLKKKSEKDAIKFNIDKGYINSDGSSKHYISPKIYDVLKNDAKNGTQTKIIGGLFQTIDRKFYREELTQIINTQRKFHTKTLDDKAVFEKCVKLLYPNNEQHAKMLLENKGQITNLLVNDIVFYQRPLESKKSEITDCKYEIDYWKEITDESTGEVKEIPIYKKAVAISHPLFQEFRIWDKIHNIKLIEIEQKGESKETQTNVDVTEQYFTDEAYLKLFHLFNSRTSVKMGDFLDFCSKEFNIKVGKKEERNFVWNYPEEEEFKGNETRKSFEIRFKRCGFTDFNAFMTQQKEMELWHYLYSVSAEERKRESQSAEKKGKKSIQNFFTKYFKDVEISNEVLERLCNDFENYPKFESKYGAYSEKALKKILSVMRVGDNFITSSEDSPLKSLYLDRVNLILEKLPQIKWENENFDFSKIVINEVDLKNKELPLPKGLFSAFRGFTDVENFKFLDLTKASYLLYGRHSELAHIKYWNSPEKIREGISEELKQHSLNNPTAEKVIKEMMKLVADIWEYYGEGKENFFDEIHLEVARELQKSNQEKAEINKNQQNNRKENNRLRNILKDFLQSEEYSAQVGNQDHFERLKIIEEGARIRSAYDKDFYKANEKNFAKKEIDEILKKTKISRDDFEKYKLWLEQGYKSPYTGNFIKLSDLFDGDKYNIDHIFPRALVTNDSLNNKVVCEAFINRFKSDDTGRGFIIQKGGKEYEEFDAVLNKKVKFRLLNEAEYESLVIKQFKGVKKYILLSNEVPSGFTKSQLNTTRHIARKAMELLSHIVREKGEIEFRAKRLLPITGKITSQLKNEWKFNEIWTELLTPRFERLNELYNTSDFGVEKKSKSGHSYFDINTEYIKEKNENFELKRLDHRHHALDALIVALCTENHVQYINNINSGITNKKAKEKIYAIKKQRESIKRLIQYNEPNKENSKEKVWRFMLPGDFRDKNATDNGKDSVVNLFWENGISEKSRDYKKSILESLERCVVSFKNDFKVVSKTFNLYESYYDQNGKLRLDENGIPKKELVKQDNANRKHWAVRKSLHKANPYGKVKLYYDNLKIIDNLGKSDFIIDEQIKDKVKEVLGMFDNKVGQASKYLKSHPITIDETIIEYTDFRVENTKFRKRQSITELAKRTGQGALKTLKDVENKINKISNKDLKDDLIRHLREKNNDIDAAFSLEGINEFNSKRKSPVYRLPISESSELKFNIGNKKFNNHKYGESEQGTNLFFVVYEDKETREKHFVIPSLREIIEHQKEQEKLGIKKEERTLFPINNTITKDKKVIEAKYCFYLSPNDLVYVPTPDEAVETIDFDNLTKEQLERVYNVNDFSSTCYFTPNTFAKAIVPKEVDLKQGKDKLQGSYDSKTASLGDKQIKDICIKLKVDRLGNISKF